MLVSAQDIELTRAIRERHDEACVLGHDTYIDPKTGYRVFTAKALLERGTCCGSGCRHCPFDADACISL